MVRTRPHLSAASLVSACFVSLLLVGCSGDEPIERYSVPKEQAAPAREVRLLSAVYTRPDATWFLRLEGPADAVGEASVAFEKFAQSVRFPEGQAIDWTLPEGWKRGPGNQTSFATLRFTTAGKQDLEVAVSRFADYHAAWVDDVNRWRGRVGLGPIGADRANDSVRDLKTEAGEAFRVVDLTGPGKGRSAPPPPRPAPAEAEPRDGIAYDVPGGWNEIKPPRKQFAMQEFVAGDGPDAPSVTVTAAGGSVPANLNRWRASLGLPELEPKELSKDVSEIEILGKPAFLVDYTGSMNSTPRRQVAVIVPLGERAIFYKMIGSPEAVGKQRPAFEAFLKSIRTGEEKGKP
jgi:hypothetical protein